MYKTEKKKKKHSRKKYLSTLFEIYFVTGEKNTKRIGDIELDIECSIYVHYPSNV